jgi:hypothetical protein
LQLNQGVECHHESFSVKACARKPFSRYSEQGLPEILRQQGARKIAAFQAVPSGQNWSLCRDFPHCAHDGDKIWAIKHMAHLLLLFRGFTLAPNFAFVNKQS